MYYVVFEFDAWPTGQQAHAMLDAVGNYGFTTYFRSAHDPYVSGYIPEYAAEGWVVNLQWVGFNSQY